MSRFNINEFKATGPMGIQRRSMYNFTFSGFGSPDEDRLSFVTMKFLYRDGKLIIDFCESEDHMVTKFLNIRSFGQIRLELFDTKGKGILLFDNRFMAPKLYEVSGSFYDQHDVMNISLCFEEEI